MELSEADNIFEYFYYNIRDEVQKKVCVKTTDLAFYLVYHFPRTRSLHYLLPDKTLNTLKANESISYENFIKKASKIKEFGILRDDEISYIVNSALYNEELVYLLDELVDSLNKKDIDILLGKISYYSKLKSLIEYVNYIDEEKFERINKSDILNLILRIVLSVLPQLPSDQKYSVFSDHLNYNSSGSPIEYSLKVGKFRSSFNDFNESFDEDNKSSMLFSDRLLLLISLMEGLFWLNEPDYSFYIGNLYDFLGKDQNNLAVINKNLIYLKPIEFYFYGKFKSSVNIAESIKNEILIYLSDIIQFSKLYILKNNYNDSQNIKELISPYWPKTIIHGLSNVFLPSTITVFNSAFGKEVYTFQYEDIFDSISIFKNPWAFYKEKDVTKEIVEISEKEGVSLNRGNKIAIVIKNALGNAIKIELDFNWERETKDISEQLKIEVEFIRKLNSHFIEYFHNYKFALNDLVDKLLYINKSVILNSDGSKWYNKAFCDYYMIFDRFRHGLNDDNSLKNEEKLKEEKSFDLVDKHRKYRSCEKTIYEKFEEGETIIDVGIGYGRFQYNVFKNHNKNIEFIGVDVSNLLLQELKTSYLVQEYYVRENSDDHFEISNHQERINTKPIRTVSCDFRNIDFLGQNIADFVCFIYTTFGYFDAEGENEEVLIKAFSLLKPGGKLIIEQFNPALEPEHCNRVPEIFKTRYNGRKYQLVKSSNFITTDKSQAQFALYYGNYVYYDITSDKEEIVKCDTYRIKLYTTEWFKNKISKVINKYLNIDDFVNVEYPDVIDSDGKNAKFIVIIEITKPTKEEEDLANENEWFKRNSFTIHKAIRDALANFYDEQYKNSIYQSDIRKILKICKKDTETKVKQSIKGNSELDQSEFEFHYNGEDLLKVMKRYEIL